MLILLLSIRRDKNEILKKMKIKGRIISVKQIVCLAAYYGIARYLPESHKYGNWGGNS